MPIKFKASGWKPGEQALDFLVFFIWAYLFVNLDNVVAAGYFIFLVIYHLMREEQKGDKNPTVYPISWKPYGNLFRDILLGLILGLGYLYFTAGIFGSLVLSILAGSLLQGLGLLATMSPVVAILVSGPLVAYTEEKFFRGAMLPFVTSIIGANLLLNAVANGCIFALWPLLEYGVTTNQALLVAGVFGSFTSIVVWNKMELKHAMVAHALFNTVIVAISYGMLNLAFLGL